MRPIVATLLLVSATACQALTPLPVARGTLKTLTAGDRGCYVEVTDATGAQRELLAAFEICEQTALIGKRVQWTTRVESVAAESCQGDPECQDSEKVMLVVELRAAE